jgi:RNA recognition motif-containing protein
MMKIYVGNLAFGTSEDDLQKAFAEFGQVDSVAIVKDKYSGESRGFGFIEMADSGAAAKAIESLNGTEMGGRNLTVNESRPRTDDRAGGYNRDRR